MLLGAIGGNGILDCFGIAVLAGADDFEIGLGVVELLAGILHALAKVAAQAVPELELDLLGHGWRRTKPGGQQPCGQTNFHTKTLH